MAKKKAGAGNKGAAKQEAKDLKKKKQGEKASKAAKKKSGKASKNRSPLGTNYTCSTQIINGTLTVDSAG